MSAAPGVLRDEGARTGVVALGIIEVMRRQNRRTVRRSPALRGWLASARSGRSIHRSEKYALLQRLDQLHSWRRMPTPCPARPRERCSAPSRSASPGLLGLRRESSPLGILIASSSSEKSDTVRNRPGARRLPGAAEKRPSLPAPSVTIGVTLGESRRRRMANVPDQSRHPKDAPPGTWKRKSLVTRRHARVDAISTVRGAWVSAAGNVAR